MSLKPTVKGYYSSDVENLSTWIPASLEDVYYPMEMSIGIRDEKQADIFQVVVATPEAIRLRSSSAEMLVRATPLVGHRT